MGWPYRGRIVRATLRLPWNGSIGDNCRVTGRSGRIGSIRLINAAITPIK